MPTVQIFEVEEADGQDNFGGVEYEPSQAPGDGETQNPGKHKKCLEARVIAQFAREMSLDALHCHWMPFILNLQLQAPEIWM